MYREIFVESIVRGMGKTTGAFIVLGIVGAAMFCEDSIRGKSKRIKRKRGSVQGTQTPEGTPEGTDDFETPVREEFVEGENRFKKMFDGM